MITLAQTRKAKPVPIVLDGKDYWQRLLNLEVLIEEGAISPDDLKLLSYVDKRKETWPVIRELYGLHSRWFALGEHFTIGHQSSVHHLHDVRYSVS